MGEHELKLLIIDDEKLIRDEIKEFLLGIGYQVMEAGSGAEALEILKSHKINIVILDIRLPDMNGLQVLEKIKQEFHDIEVIMITAHADISNLTEATRLGAFDFFYKPLHLFEIQNSIERTKKYIDINHRLKKIEAQYYLTFQELSKQLKSPLIFDSPTMRKVLELSDKAAAARNTSVLVTGPTGSGKELIARGIHYASERKDHYFYALNCSAIPETLVESELFGHKKGAFTGALENKMGCFEAANGGTLFLDEIGDMPISIQTKILRILEDRRIKRLGSNEEVAVDLRIISATNRDIIQLIHTDKFRSDLYYRLNGFEIRIPPLKEHAEDVPKLVDYYIKHYTSQINKTIRGIDANALKILCRYEFPGNIRELKNLVERAVILCNEDMLRLKDFPMIFEQKFEGNDEDEKTDETLDLGLMEQKFIKKALEKTGHNKNQAAKLLNISWHALHRKLKKYKLYGCATPE